MVTHLGLNCLQSVIGAVKDGVIGAFGEYHHSNCMVYGCILEGVLRSGYENCNHKLNIVQ